MGLVNNIGALHLYTEQELKLRKVMRRLLETDKKALALTYPKVDSEYKEPTYGQLLAIKAKDKQLFVEQKDGSYIQVVAGQNRAIHRCPVNKEEVLQYIEYCTDAHRG